jgi:catechol 2,3-dioxygenase-like lactoylglutathione lyase family enzyme
MRLDAIVIDCRDAAPLARFWAGALGWSVAPYDEGELARLASRGIDDPEDDPTVIVEPPDDALEEPPVLFFVEVPEGKVVKNRLHLDLRAEEDLEIEVGRLEGLGARIRNWAEGDGGIRCVMLDPEGNEFCVMPPDDEVA